MSETTERNFRSPVAWLLGRQLLSSLKRIVLYSAFGRQIDPKKWMSAEEIDLAGHSGGRDEFWFDYAADVGDGMRAVYSIGAMALADWQAKDGELRKGAGLELAETEESTDLPRGSFLFLGGDTCYHIADYPTLADRFQRPLRWAFEDLEALGSKPEGGRENGRPIFGIPGNHDYYDTLNGFYLQFRKPSPGVHDRDWENKPDPDMVTAKLFLKGFRRVQEASYVALKLPFGWRLWGLDTQHGELDERQKYFFRGLMENESSPDKLIVATPEPTTVFGRYCRPEAPVAKSFQDLKLPRPFLTSGEAGSREELPEGACRLDLSGDVHHYARYLGGDEDEPSRYASVVSGGGGAFLHPTVTDFGEVEPEEIYPDPESSHREVTRRLLNPWNIMRGGYVWLAGALVTLVLVFGMTLAESSRSVTNRLLEAVGLVPLGVVAESWKGEYLVALESVFEVPRMEDLATRPLLHPELGFVVLFVALFAFGAWQSHRWCRRARGIVGDGWEEVKVRSYWGIYAVLPMAVILSNLWIFRYDPGSLHPLASSSLVLFFLIVTVLAFVWSREYGDALVHQARVRYLKYRDHVLLWFLVVFALATLCFGVWRYGVDPLAVVVSDVIFLGGVLFLGLGLPGLAVVVGAQRHGVGGKLGFLLLGLWHLALQATLPVLLALYCDPWMSLAMAGAVAAVSASAWSWSKWGGAFGKWGLLVQWVLLGGAVLALVFAMALKASEGGEPVGLTVPRFALALLLGAVLSCVWFGWYLAVSVPFNGHNNEAGGGSRLEKYKQMIRFRLTANELTGYVIAVDEPVTDVRELRPRVVDVFRIRARRQES